MRLQFTALLVAAAIFFTGVVADEHTSQAQATLTLTRTVQRVVQTVTATRLASTASIATSIASASHGSGYANGTTVTTASLTASATPARQTGAGSVLNAEMIGMAAIAGLAGLMAL